MIKKIHKLSLCLLSVIICSTTYCATSNQKTLSKKILNTSQMSYQELRNASQKIFDSITDLKRKQSIQEKILNLLKKKNTDKTQNKIEVIQVKFRRKELDQDGNPTPKGLQRLFIEQYFPKNAKNIIVEIFQGGERNRALYRVFEIQNQNQNIFFAKISAGSIFSSIESLQKVQAGPAGRIGLDNFYYPGSKTAIPNDKLPRLVWVETFWVYTDQYGEQKTIEITHGAKGFLVETIFKSTDQDLKDRCCNALATAFANFQQAFMVYNEPDSISYWNTMTHFDLHTGNIVFNPTTSQIYFIDNSTMTNNIGILTDLETLVTCIPLNLRLKFLRAYIEAYPQDKHQILLETFGIPT